MADLRELIRLAVEARDRAHAPYSNHPVGAALVTDTGAVFSGCNVENVAFPLGSCAEQSAIAAMVLGGGGIIREMAVVGPAGVACAPCGGCRQRIFEFADRDTRVHVCNEREPLQTMSIEELLPVPFGRDGLNDTKT